MALPLIGLIKASDINAELGRGYNAAFSMNGGPERTLAGVPSGNIKFSDFHGKTNEIVKTMTGGSGRQDLSSFFSVSEWQSGITKRVIFPQNLERGLTGHTNPVIACVPNSWAHGGWGGELIFDIQGTISGAGGATNGGTGGRCLDANILGASGQKVSINVLPTGLVRAGGGGGGKGGTGGGGTHAYTIRQPATGEAYEAGTTLWTTHMYSATIVWEGTTLTTTAGGYATSVTIGDWTYHIGTRRGGVPQNNLTHYALYRVRSQSDTTYGGAGGDGGRGQGYNVNRAYGSGGSPGGPSAGSGGDGGRGGAWAAPGATGTSGSNGNRTSGAAGSSGGQPGFATVNEANMTLTINGTVIGRRS